MLRTLGPDFEAIEEKDAHKQAGKVLSVKLAWMILCRCSCPPTLNRTTHRVEARWKAIGLTMSA